MKVRPFLHEEKAETGKLPVRNQTFLLQDHTTDSIRPGFMEYLHGLLSLKSSNGKME